MSKQDFDAPLTSQPLADPSAASAKNAATAPLSPSRLLTDRYVPRAINGGPEWAVFDRKLNRALTDAEIDVLSIDALQNEKWPCH